MEWLKNLSPRDKVLVIGGGALVLLFLFRTLTGNKTPDAGTSIDQTQATAQAEQQFEQNVTQALQQNNQAMQEALTAQTQGLLQMMSGFQERQTKAFSDLETTLQTATTTQNNQVSNLLSQMSKPIIYSSPSSSQSGGGGGDSSTKSKPSVTVVKGSVDEKILKAQYGDSISFNYSPNNINQFTGADRFQTNAEFQSYLAAQGVTPINPNVGDLYAYGQGIH